MIELSRVAMRKVEFRCHDLRHTFVTKCRDSGVDIHVCMKWCGHTSERMILQIYDHVTEDRENEAIQMLQNSAYVKKQLSRFPKAL